VLAINLMPIFGPPTWAILVLFRLNSSLGLVPLVLIGATAAASGRLILGTVTGKLRNFVGPKHKANLTAAREYLNKRKSIFLFNLSFFAISPLPSAQLFEAAGLLGLNLFPVTLAFIIGRLISYTVYLVGATTLKENGVGQLIIDNLKSPFGVFIQLIGLLGIYGLTKIDWIKLLNKGSTSGA
jgi:membrane protein YqaA with SNARE-associated domain